LDHEDLPAHIELSRRLPRRIDKIHSAPGVGARSRHARESARKYSAPALRPRMVQKVGYRGAGGALLRQ
jgi:hypothetical protein